MMMGPGSLLLSLILIISSFPSSFQEEVTISIKGVTTIAKTDDNFVCATLDWWPTEKCNYGMCPRGKAGIPNLDLKNPILFNAINAFDSVRIRLGGSLQDQVVYKVGPKPPKCHKFTKDENGLFGFSEGCLTMHKWKKLNELLQRSGAIVTFGLNALSGRKKVSNSTLYVGKWDPTNARDFINYTISKGYKVESWELGNELSGDGVSGKVNAKQYGEDLIVLKGIIDDLYNNSEKKPKLLAPGGFFDEQWFAEMLSTSGLGVIDVVTHHIYNLGGGDNPNLIYNIQDPYYLDKVAQTYQDVEMTIDRFGPWSSAWVGESGGAFNSGGRNVSNTYLDGFWYLDQLGMTSTFNHKVFCRQALIGGNYPLLDTDTFIPNPDYYSALLWHRLMGPEVLGTAHSGSPYLRAYAHCSRDGEEGNTPVTLMLINMSNSTAFHVSVASDLNLFGPPMFHSETSIAVLGEREEYYLTPKDGNVRSRVMLLNGYPLNVTSAGEIPEMHPMIVDASAPLFIGPQAITFIRFKDFKAPACSK